MQYILTPFSIPDICPHTQVNQTCDHLSISSLRQGSFPILTDMRYLQWYNDHPKRSMESKDRTQWHRQQLCNQGHQKLSLLRSCGIKAAFNRSRILAHCNRCAKWYTPLFLCMTQKFLHIVIIRSQQLHSSKYSLIDGFRMYASDILPLVSSSLSTNSSGGLAEYGVTSIEYPKI